MLEKKDLLKMFQEGQIVSGVVKNITDFGIFVDLGGMDGLLHITDISWGRVNHPSEFLNINDEIKVMVLKVDREKRRLTIGLKQLQPDPWTWVENQYTPGMRAQGKVISIAEYGVFLELEPGVEGLVHISEISWLTKEPKIFEDFHEGQLVEAMILTVDAIRCQISLGVKQLKENPYEQFSKKYPVGSKVTGSVHNITDFGMFLILDFGVKGLVHLSDISWDDADDVAIKSFKEGDRVDACVLNVDVEKERIVLGIKQLQQNL